MKTVFSDIDGTFYEMGQEVSKINIEAVQALQAQGDRFVFISGRALSQISNMLEEHGIVCDVIFGNGVGHQIVGEEANYEYPLALDDVEQVLAFLDAQDIFYHVHTSDSIFLKPLHQFKPHLSKLREKFSDLLGARGHSVMDIKEEYLTNDSQHETDLIAYFREHPEIQLLKIEIMDADDEVLDRIKKELTSEKLYVFSSFTTALEIVDPSSNKGDAIHRYLERFPSKKTYGIGDAENDLSMLEVVDIPVAVGNGTEAVKEKCQLIIKDCSDGGVGHFIFDELIHSPENTE